MVLKIISQNVARAHLGERRRGGNIAPLRLQVNFEKPDIIIITEICEDEQYTGSKTFKGYSMTQYSKNRLRIRTGGTAVFIRNTLECIPGSVYNSNTGHYSIAVYLHDTSKIIVAAIYGPSSPSDPEAVLLYTEILNKIREYMQLYSTRLMVLGGDFNINLDKRRSSKPHTVLLVKRFVSEFNLIDAGVDRKEATWRRPHLPGSSSRIDYHILSRDLTIVDYHIRWTRFDHALLCTKIAINDSQRFKNILKDWSLASTMFQESAPIVLEKLLLDSDQEMCNANNLEKEQFVNGRLIHEYEAELNIINKKEGFFYSHLLLNIIENLLQLQKKVQNKLKHKRKAELQRMSKELAILYNRIDNLPPDCPDILNINEQIIDLRNKIKIDCDNIEHADRLRISHFYESSAGKNVAASFYVCKDQKRGGGGAKGS